MNELADFWTSDVSSLYRTSFQFRWERWDERKPEIRGEERLTLELPSPYPGRLYTLPSRDVRAEYAMATPAKGQGARAVELRGVVRVVDGLRVRLDLKARMERIDAPGVEFDEAVRGEFWVP